MAKPFPRTITVTRENSGTDDEYLGVTDTDAITESTQVAVYELVEVGIISVRREYVANANGKRRVR